MTEGFDCSEINDIVVLKFKLDQIDMFNIVEFLDDYENNFSYDIKCLLDLESVKFIDSSGLGGIIKLEKKITATGGMICLCNLSKTVESLFKLTQLTSFLNVYDNVDLAVRSMQE